MKKIFTLFLLLSIFSLPGLILAFPDRAGEEKASTIQVRQSRPQFALTVESNPTTGFSWHLDSYEADVIEVVGRVYRAPEGGALGASGFEVWTFRARPGAFVAPRVTRIRLLYLRPWDAKDEPREAVFTIVLVPDA